MYLPAHFNETRIPVLHEAMQQIGLATVVTSGSEGMEASHLPLLISAEPAPFGTLHGHMARANPQWRRFSPGGEALAIFLGPNTYVSPSWYPTKEQTGEVVPTWNYLAIHAYGTLGFFDDREQLRAHVGALTAAHEAGRPAPWAMSDAPAAYLDKMLAAIVGFKLVITRLEGKWKMSQNRLPQDIAGVREGLRREDSPAQRAVAKAMAKSDLAPKPDRG